MARQCKRAAESSPCNKRGPRRDVANVCRIRQSQEARLGKPVLIPDLNANVSKISHPHAIDATSPPHDDTQEKKAPK